MILLWGLPGDRPLAVVHEALQRLGCSVVFLDQRAVLDTEVELCSGFHVEGVVRTREQVIDLNTVNAVYLRPYDSRRLPSVASAGPASPAYRHALDIEDVLLSWIELTSAFVVNPPLAMATNNSKPFQTDWIRSWGFDTPDTLITTDPGAALEFWKHYETVIYKSVSSVRSIVARLTAQDIERLDDVAWCPTQFQQYIPGKDYRVHVVGEQTFACEVVSGADDYRYASRQGAGVNITPYDLPEDVATRCKALAASMHLVVAGIDLRHTPDDKWYCFEVNPSPGFTYYQDATQLPIAEAVARLLMSGGVNSAIC